MSLDAKKLKDEMVAGTVPDEFDIDAEVSHLAALWEKLPFRDDYDLFKYEGAGGSGVVLSAEYKRFHTRRAVKLPRLAIYNSPPSAEDHPEEDPELRALERLSHPNITRLFEPAKAPGGRGAVAVTQVVNSARALDKYADHLCCNSECRSSDSQRSHAVRRLATIIYDAVTALEHMHNTGLLHFDVKPDNILVDDSGHVFITDLGFAREFGPGATYPTETTRVGFTYKYAHPSLTDPDKGARITRTAARATNQVRVDTLSPILDVFAFGRTVQETLKKLDDVYSENIHSDYTFNYLHLVAALCLDGWNAANNSGGPMSSFVSDQPFSLSTKILAVHKYSSFTDIRIALERLLGLRRVEDEVPELDPWSASTLNVSDIGIATMTPRVKSLAEHPVLRRLGAEYQLGMLDVVFPTATHSRLQHSLGVYHAACRYILALYYDSENPTFRVLFSPHLARVTLLGALVHDVGHTTFGHELEEVGSMFSHTAIGARLMTNSALKDRRQRTLQQIVEGSGDDEWGLKMEDVLRFMRGEFKRPIELAFHNVLDGQLDADKLDYLVRDSVECRVQYGRGIDVERFLRSLTTAPSEDTEHIGLAIKKKGSASAEAFALARYQLYQSLYWHHTVRAVKSMLLTAAAGVVHGKPDAGTQVELGALDVVDRYVEEVVGLPRQGEIPERRGRGKKSKEPEMPDMGEHPASRTLRFLYRLANDPRDRELLRDLATRRLYRRLIEVPASQLSEDLLGKLKTGLERERCALQAKISEELEKALRTAIQGQSVIRASLAEDDTLTCFERVVNERYPFLVDLPLVGWSAAGDEPRFVTDYKRRYFREFAGHSPREDPTLWKDVLGAMMKRIAMFRVYADPEVHRIVTRVMKPAGIVAAINQALPGFRRATGEH
jgi:serine/threonine protein kinase